MLRGIWPEIQPGGPRADTSGGAALYLFAVRERVSHPVQLADSHEAVSRQGTQALVSHGSKLQYSVRSSCQLLLGGTRWCRSLPNFSK
jgi:hypothetical protein